MLSGTCPLRCKQPEVLEPIVTVEKAQVYDSEIDYLRHYGHDPKESPFYAETAAGS